MWLPSINTNSFSTVVVCPKKIAKFTSFTFHVKCVKQNKIQNNNSKNHECNKLLLSKKMLIALQTDKKDRYLDVIGLGFHIYIYIKNQEKKWKNRTQQVNFKLKNGKIEKKFLP